MLPVTRDSLSHILHWFKHVIDNCNLKTNLRCNESLFQQTKYGKKQIHYVRMSRFPPMGFFRHQANMKYYTINYSYTFAFDNFV